MADIPRRSSTLFEKSGAKVRRLARRISLSILRDRSDTRPSSAATVRSNSSESTVTHAGPDRPSSRLMRWRSSSRSSASNVSSVAASTLVEEPMPIAEAMLRSATPRGFDGGKKQANKVAVQLPWAMPAARVLRNGRGTAGTQYDVGPLVYARQVRWFSGPPRRGRAH